MFGGITETIGTIVNLEEKDHCLHLEIQPAIVFDDLKIGDSIAVNGICLTITQLRNTTFLVTAVPETLQITNLKFLKKDDRVNLERALSTQSRIGGHYVQGHVDFCGELISIENDGKLAKIAKISYPPSFKKYMIKKGYITLDGMSITLVDITNAYFSVVFIPHTQAISIVSTYEIGAKINVEVDMIGKYIENLFSRYSYDKQH